MHLVSVWSQKAWLTRSFFVTMKVVVGCSFISSDKEQSVSALGSRPATPFPPMDARSSGFHRFHSRKHLFFWLLVSLSVNANPARFKARKRPRKGRQCEKRPPPSCSDSTTMDGWLLCFALPCFATLVQMEKMAWEGRSHFSWSQASRSFRKRTTRHWRGGSNERGRSFIRPSVCRSFTKWLGDGRCVSFLVLWFSLATIGPKPGLTHHHILGKKTRTLWQWRRWGVRWII